MKTALALIAVVFSLSTGCGRSEKFCQVCGREECSALAFQMTLEDGKRVETCCPRCGLHYLENRGQKAREFRASDFASGQWIDASKAVYVSGSEVAPCVSIEVRRDSHGACCAYKTYDRCMPSLIAFEDRDEAAEFAGKYGGTLVKLDEIASKGE